MTLQLSTVNIYEPLLTGGAFKRDITALVWPTWRRLTVDQGGDHSADFLVDTSSHPVSRQDLEWFFTDWIGCHVVERFGGVVTFEGFVHTLRLYVGGAALVITMDGLANYVQTLYTADSAATEAASTLVEDTPSQDRYGRHVSIKPAAGYVAQALADDKAEEILRNYAWPRVVVTEIDIAGDDSVYLEVDIRGYIHTLKNRYTHITYAASASSNTMAQITALLAVEDFVTEGTVAASSVSTTNEAYYLPKLDKLYELMENTPYVWGCFGGRVFTSRIQTYTEIKYRRRSFDTHRGLYTKNGLRVADALVQPGVVVWTEDIFSGRAQEATLLNDPRAAWVSSVEYNIDGVRLQAADQPEEFIGYLAMAQETDPTQASKSAEDAGRAAEHMPTGTRQRD